MCEQRIAFLFVNIQTSALCDSISGLPVSREDVLASLFFFFFFFVLARMHKELPSPGIELMCPALEVPSVNHWTTMEV